MKRNYPSHIYLNTMHIPGTVMGNGNFLKPSCPKKRDTIPQWITVGIVRGWIPKSSRHEWCTSLGIRIRYDIKKMQNNCVACYRVGDEWRMWHTVKYTDNLCTNTNILPSSINQPQPISGRPTVYCAKIHRWKIPWIIWRQGRLYFISKSTTVRVNWLLGQRTIYTPWFPPIPVLTQNEASTDQ